MSYGKGFRRRGFGNKSGVAGGLIAVLVILKIVTRVMNGVGDDHERMEDDCGMWPSS